MPFGVQVNDRKFKKILIFFFNAAIDNIKLITENRGDRAKEKANILTFILNVRLSFEQEN